ncbi:hypothetical protein AAZX31_08G275600 [Glycine max]
MLQLHLGVNSGAARFVIEHQAANEPTFRCPDELGWQPQVRLDFPIVLEDGGISRTRQHSLRFAEQKGNKSLFVHVPLFSRVDQETQMRFTASLVDVIASAC